MRPTSIVGVWRSDGALRTEGGNMNIRNRWFLLLAGVMSFGLVAAAACGGGTSSSDKTATAAAGGGGAKTATGTSTGGGGAASADQQKITLQSGEPQYLDPH